jgi:hypothetical protein
LDSGAGGGFLLDTAIGKAAGLHGARRERGFGAGPDSVVDEIVPDTALQVDKLHLPRQSIHLRALSGDACIIGTKLLDRFVVEIDYLTPEVRLFAAGGYSPPGPHGQAAASVRWERASRSCCAANSATTRCSDG